MLCSNYLDICNNLWAPQEEVSGFFYFGVLNTQHKIHAISSIYSYRMNDFKVLNKLLLNKTLQESNKVKMFSKECCLTRYSFCTPKPLIYNHKGPPKFLSVTVTWKNFGICEGYINICWWRLDLYHNIGLGVRLRLGMSIVYSLLCYQYLEWIRFVKERECQCCWYVKMKNENWSVAPPNVH